jgi:hypothetical protein
MHEDYYAANIYNDQFELEQWRWSIADTFRKYRNKYALLNLNRPWYGRKVIFILIRGASDTHLMFNVLTNTGWMSGQSISFDMIQGYRIFRIIENREGSM